MEQSALQWTLIGGVVLALGVTFVAFCCYRKTRRILERLMVMLDEAMEGRFTECTYDESMLSAVETKLKHWISKANVTSKQLTMEHEKVKAMISDISHQTKTPIANISIFSELLLEQELSTDCEEYVNLLRKQSIKLSFLIDALIKASRLETGVVKINLMQVEVLELIAQVCEEANKKVELKHMKFFCNLEPLKLVLDFKWTKEALYNVIDNAIKYGSEGSQITICGTKYELFYRIDITNKGVGISEDERSKIFTRFYRSKEVADYEGVGLGLYLVREIVTMQGGYIKVHSKQKETTTFSIFLKIE